jgi:glucose-6-phosphate dehydrogenase assembly protein OpcA
MTSLRSTAEAEGWAFEEASPAEIDELLERQRREAQQGDGGRPLVRASVANMVVVTHTRADGQRALAEVEGLGRWAPSRCVALIAEPPPAHGRQRVRAWARAVHRHPELVWEEVVVQTNVDPDRLSAVVLPLLLPELPVFTWWFGTPPFGQEVSEELTSVADRLIVNSAAFDDPAGDLARLAHTVPKLQAAVSDMVWGRLTPWRELLAAPFGGPPLREAIERVCRLRIDAVEPTAGLLLAGWFASRLGWQLDHAELVDDEHTAHYTTPTGTCEVRLAATLGAGTLTAVELEVGCDAGPVTVRVEARPKYLVASVAAAGQPPSRRRVGASPDRSQLAAELEVFGRDRIFEESLAQAAALAEAPGPKEPG